MVVHLSPKAKALTLPLNWSQFLKTLIGAENYTLFQLPPNKTGVRPSPSSFIRPRCTLLPLVFSSFVFDFCHSDISFSATSKPFAKYRDRADEQSLKAGEIFIETETHVVRMARPITGQSVARLWNEISVRGPNISAASACQLRQSSFIRASRFRCAKSHRPFVSSGASPVTLLTSSSSPVARRERLEMSHKIK